MKPTALALSFVCSLSLIGCAAEGGDPGETDCDGDKCDDLDKPDSAIPDSPCDGIMVDKSGRNHEKVAGRLHDPLAQFVLQAGDDCPVTFQDIVAKLQANDNQDCSNTNGMLSRAISETAQITAKATSYRTVTSRTCGGRDNHGLLFSLFGVTSTTKTLPKNVEMIAFDATAGVFNYYETDGQTLNFFGNSPDMLKGKGEDDDRRCAGCHVGGGLIMKELRAPWLHWEGDTTTPGVDTLVNGNSQFLGSKSNGIELEGTVDSANSIWNARRIDFMKKVGDTRELLRPLFCTPEIQIGSGGPGDVSSVPGDLLLDPVLNNFPFLSFENADYKALLTANGQEVPGTGKADTFFPFAFPHRSSIDADYVQQLIAKRVVSQEFVKDVLSVDFTRPIFSEDRCALLDLVPSIPSSSLSGKALTEGMIASIGTPAAGSPAAELLAQFKASGGWESRVQTFTDACAARPQNELLADILKVTSLLRDQARERQVIEFEETMPDDDQSVAAGTRLHPVTCTITSDFVPVRAAAE
jgi:hypothetical protein